VSIKPGKTSMSLPSIDSSGVKLGGQSLALPTKTIAVVLDRDRTASENPSLRVYRHEPIDVVNQYS
jgi:hypothetical protein